MEFGFEFKSKLYEWNDYISSDILVALYMYVQEYYIAVGQNL